MFNQNNATFTSGLIIYFEEGQKKPSQLWGRLGGYYSLIFRGMSVLQWLVGAEHGDLLVEHVDNRL